MRWGEVRLAILERLIQQRVEMRIRELLVDLGSDLERPFLSGPQPVRLVLRGGESQRAFRVTNSLTLSCGQFEEQISQLAAAVTPTGKPITF